MKKSNEHVGRRGAGQRLTDGQRVEILKLFESGAAITEADVARRYGVTRSAIWRLRRTGAHIMERYHDGDVESRDSRRRGSNSSLPSASAVLGGAAGGPVGGMTVMPSAESLAFAVSGGGAAPALRPGTATSMPVAAGLAPVTASLKGEEVARPSTDALDNTQPLVYMAAKAIGSVQSPGLMNWERVSGNMDETYFEVVNDGLSVLQEGNYQINVDVEHSQPRQNYKFAFKVWHEKKLLGQCGFPLRIKKEIALSLLEMRCRLPALAKLRVEFLAPGFAFHESRLVLRLVQ